MNRRTTRTGQLYGASITEMYYRDVRDKGLLTREDETYLGRRIDDEYEKLHQAELILKRTERKGGKGPHRRRANLQKEALRAKAAIERLRNRFIEGNLRLVIHVAGKYQCYGARFMDLIQEGNLGLIRAVEKYDHRKGTKFSTYAVCWIRLYIQRFLSMDHVIRLPFKHANRQGAHGDAASGEAVCTDAPKTRERPRPVRRVSIIDIDKREDGRTEPPQALMFDRTPLPFETVAKTTLGEKVNAALNGLDPREREVLQLYFGLLDGREKTLSEIGDLMGVSQQRVFQLKDRAVRKLRAEPALHVVRPMLSLG